MTKIGFALLSDSNNPIPSTRIACLNLFPLFKKAEVEPIVLFEPVRSTECPDVGDLVEKAVAAGVAAVVFQKIYGPSVLAAMRGLRLAGIASIYCVCDIVDNEVAATADATIIVTEYLKSLYRKDLHSRIFVVHDGIEHPEVERVDSPAHSRVLQAALVTSQELYKLPVFDCPPHGWQVNVIGRFPDAAKRLDRFNMFRWNLAEQKGVEKRLSFLKSALHHRIKRIAWDPLGVYENLRRSDIGIIPVDTTDNTLVSTAPDPVWKLKSENRLTLNMAIGLPVIATPIPSYEDVIEHGKNGLFARSRRDWLDSFSLLRDPDVRNEMGINARLSVLNRFSIELQAEKFLNVVFAVTGNSGMQVQTGLNHQA